MTRVVPEGATPKRRNVLSAFRHRNYRLYYTGLVLSITGFWINTVAQSWLVLELTDSPFYPGLVGLFTSVPTIALSIFGGVLADRVERRRLLRYYPDSFFSIQAGTAIDWPIGTGWTLQLVLYDYGQYRASSPSAG